MYNDVHGKIRPFRQNVITADGNKAHIIGIKKVKIQIGEWIFVTDVLISNNLIKTCIIGMDILSILPSVKNVISDLQSAIQASTKTLKHKRQTTIPTQQNTIFEQRINNIDIFCDCNHLDQQSFSFNGKKTNIKHQNRTVATQTETVFENSHSTTILNQTTEITDNKKEVKQSVFQNKNIKSTSELQSDKENECNANFTESSFCIAAIEASNSINAKELTVKDAKQIVSELLETVSISKLSELKTTTNAAMHYIKIKPGTEPIKQKQRRIMHHFQKDFDKVLDDMLEAGKIEECTDSGWASPLRLVKKSDGGVRITVDYKLLNNVTEKIAYPLPLIDEIFQRLANAKYFTVLDLTAGYYQVPLDVKSKQYTAFICNRGLFQYNVLPMGITNATETFQRMMNNVFKGLLTKCCDTYLDDIIIYSPTLQEHVKHVESVVKRLKANVLKIKIEKCKIVEEKIEYLSHVIWHGCIQPNPKKINELLKYKPPFNKKQIEAFIGKASYYRRLIKHFAIKIAPLR